MGLLLEMLWPGLDQELLDSSQWAGTIQVLPHDVGLDQPDGRDRGHVDRGNGVVKTIGQMPIADCVRDRRGSDSQFAWGHKAGCGWTLRRQRKLLESSPTTTESESRRLTVQQTV